MHFGILLCVLYYPREQDRGRGGQERGGRGARVKGVRQRGCGADNGGGWWRWFLAFIPHLLPPTPVCRPFPSDARHPDHQHSLRTPVPGAPPAGLPGGRPLRCRLLPLGSALPHPHAGDVVRRAFSLPPITSPNSIFGYIDFVDVKLFDRPVQNLIPKKNWFCGIFFALFRTHWLATWCVVQSSSIMSLDPGIPGFHPSWHQTGWTIGVTPSANYMTITMTITIWRTMVHRQKFINFLNKCFIPWHAYLVAFRAQAGWQCWVFGPSDCPDDIYPVIFRLVQFKYIK